MKKPNPLLILASLGAVAGLLLSPLQAEEQAPPPAPAAESAPAAPAPAAPPQDEAPPAPTPAASPATAENPPAPEPEKPVEQPTPASVPVEAHDTVIDREGSPTILANLAVPAGQRVREAVVICGDLTVDGAVRRDAVVVNGNAFINGPVGGQLVCILGTVELGPKAEVGGQCVVVGGALSNPHGVPIRGETVVVGLDVSKFGQGLHWIKEGLLRGRLLTPHVGWPWAVFGGFLLFYLLLAALFGRGVNACAQTLEQNPGGTIVTAFVLLPLVPLFTLVLIATGIGILLLPFLSIGIMFAKIFGKVVILAFLGRALLKSFGAAKPAESAVLTVLIGSALLALLYMVPWLGFVVYMVTGWLGFGMVMYTIVLNRRTEKAAALAAREKARAEAQAAAAAAAPAAVPANPFVVQTAPASPVVEVPLSQPETGPAPTPMMSAGFAGTAAAGGVAAPAGGVPPVMPGAGLPPRLTAEISATTCPRADFWARLGALVIDVGLVAIVAGFLSFLSFIPMPLWFGGYVFGLWLWRGTTIGGIILNLKVVRLDGRPIDPATSLVRTLAGYLSVFAAGLGFLWCAWDPEQQTWHDKVAGTVVVRVPRGTPLV